MDFSLSEEERILMALIKDFCQREIDPAYLNEIARNDDPKERIPWVLIKKLDDIGLRTLAVPTKYEGGGITSSLTLLLLGEAFTRWGGPGGLMTQGWAWCKMMDEFGNEEQKDEFFPHFMEDYKFMTGIAITESDHGTDAILPYDGPEPAMNAFAYRDGEEWVINAEKCWVSCGAIATLLCVMARTFKDKPLSQSASLFLVPTDTPGVSVVRENELIITPDRGNACVLFDNVRVPARYLWGKENEGFDYWNHMWEPIGLLRRSTTLGYLQRIYELTKDYAQSRVQGGKPLAKHDIIAYRLADIHLCIELARQFLYKVCWEIDQAERGQLRNAAGGLLGWAFTKEITMRIANHVCEIWGGSGIVKDTPIERFLRYAWSIRSPGGDITISMIKAGHSLV